MSWALPKKSSAGPLLTLVLVALLSGCAANRVISIGHLPSFRPALTTIALAPQGGTFADLIGMALAAQDYTIVDTGATLALIVLTHVPQDDPLAREVMTMLQKRGIDILLVVQKADGADGLPQTVQVRLYSTASMTEVGGVDWENGWFRRGTLESAQEIAAAMS
jgi:hypothetical protein